MMANTPPRAGIHTGISGGMFSARIIPVTRALQSYKVFGFFISFSYRYSLSIQAATVTINTNNACKPK